MVSVFKYLGETIHEPGIKTLQIKFNAKTWFRIHKI